MYWLYLIIFILAVVTPDLINRDFAYLNEERAEELVILVLGVTAFMLFLFKEKQAGLQLKAKRRIQKEASIASKDLTDTYSYIGEINRKMDILKDIALGLTEGPELTNEKEMELHRSIIHAVRMFAKSNRVSLHFINIKTNKIINEIKSSRRIRRGVISPVMSKENKSFSETEKMFFIRSPKPIGNVAACIAVEKRNKNQEIEDPELIKALASQALFLFTFSRKKG